MTKLLLKTTSILGWLQHYQVAILIVPVINQADQLNLVGLAKKVNDLALRARNNQLKPDEITGGTYTISNVGTFGNVMGLNN